VTNPQRRRPHSSRSRSLGEWEREFANTKEILSAVRDLYSRHPEYLWHEAWELQHVLFSLGYVDDLADEGEIQAAIEVARADYPQWWPAA
jgi:hypothetical protein